MQMAANPNAIARKPLSIRKPETAPQPSSVAELHEPGAATISAVTESAVEPTSGDALPDAANEASRHDDVARAAYYIAEARGFEPGHELDDWLAAEERID
jgi:hypothetical protein